MKFQQFDESKKRVNKKTTFSFSLARAIDVKAFGYIFGYSFLYILGKRRKVYKNLSVG
jgi:hypothetical protein